MYNNNTKYNILFFCFSCLQQHKEPSHQGISVWRDTERFIQASRRQHDAPSHGWSALETTLAIKSTTLAQ